MKTQITILLADDHPIVRKGLRQVIESEQFVSAIEEAEDGEAALEKIERMKPDIAILDINMPKMSGLDVARKIHEQRQTVEIIFMTMYKDQQMFDKALQVGAKGYLLKNSALMDIVECIKAVKRGDSYISAALSGFLIERRRQAESLVEHKPSLSDLTSAELRILKFIAESKSSKEIAARLFISTRTVENHRANICTKLDLRGINALLKFALEYRSELSAMSFEE
jgi:DNA-binding NarL/FixJ family response regulator